MQDERPRTRQCGGGRCGGIRPGPGRARHQHRRPDGAGDHARARRLRTQAFRHRRRAVRDNAVALRPDAARRVSAHQAQIPGRHLHRRLVLHVACRARARGDSVGDLRGGGDRLRQHAAHRIACDGFHPRIQPVRDAVPAVSARERLRIGRGAPYARVRHHPRAACGGGGRGAQMGAHEPGGLGKGTAHDRAGAQRAHGELPLHGARLLSRDRRRRRDHPHLGCAGENTEEETSVRTRRRRGVGAHYDLQHAQSHGHCGGRVRAQGVPDGGSQALRREHAVALRRFHDHTDPVPGRPRLLSQGRRRAVRG